MKFEGVSMSTENPNSEWKLAVNDRYQKFVDTVLSLSVGSLVLPTIFFREFLGVPPSEPLLNRMDLIIWCSWGILVLSIFCCIIYYYASAKWIKQAYGQELKFRSINIKENTVERVLDISFFLSFLLFILGIVLLLFFLLHYQETNPLSELKNQIMIHNI